MTSLALVFAGLLLCTACAVTGGTQTAQAEGAHGTTLTVRVPFDFRVGESHFGPGEYVISLHREATQEGSSAGSVTLESRDRSRSVTVGAKSSRASPTSAATTVSFRVYGDQRFLSSFRAEDAGGAWELAPSADERSAGLHWGAPAALSLKAEPPPPSR